MHQLDGGQEKSSVPIAHGSRFGPSAVATLMALTPAELAAGALGTGYALPTTPRGPTLRSVLASMSPEARRSTERITHLTFAQLLRLSQRGADVLSRRRGA